MPSLVIHIDGKSDEKFLLPASSLTIGRGVECEIRLNDERASRRHCQIVRAADGFTVVDLGSGNGTKVNGALIKDHKLAPGDRIQIGAVALLFTPDDAGAKPAPRPAQPVSKSTALAQRGALPAQRGALAEGGALAQQGAPVQRVTPSQTGAHAAPRATARTTGARAGISSRQTLIVRKKSSMKYVIGGIAAAAIVIIIIIASSGGPAPGIIIRDAEESIKPDVLKHKEKGDYSSAMGRCDDGIALLEPIVHVKAAKDLRKWFKDEKDRIAGLKRREDDVAAKCAEIGEQLKQTSPIPGNKEDLRRLLERAKKLIDDHQGVRVGVRKDLEKIKSDCEKAYLKASENRLGEELSVLEREASDRLRGNKYGEVVRLYNDFIGKHPGSEEAKRAGEKLEEINRQVKSQYEDVRRKAEEKAKESREDALKYLEVWGERFKGTSVERDFEAFVKDLPAKSP